MVRRYDDKTYELPNGKVVTVSRHSQEHKVLQNTLYRMRQRCTNKNDKSYNNYGARGIKCMINSTDEIVKAIGFRPDGHSIDRIDNDKHYSIDNIRWATHTTQMRNKRSSYTTTINDITKSIYDWHELLNCSINITTVRDRYQCGVRGILLFLPKYHPLISDHYHRDRNL